MFTHAHIYTCVLYTWKYIVYAYLHVFTYIHIGVCIYICIHMLAFIFESFKHLDSFYEVQIYFYISQCILIRTHTCSCVLRAGFLLCPPFTFLLVHAQRLWCLFLARLSHLVDESSTLWPQFLPKGPVSKYRHTVSQIVIIWMGHSPTWRESGLERQESQIELVRSKVWAVESCVIIDENPMHACVHACVFHTYFLYISICYFVVGKVAFEQQCLSPRSSLFLLAVFLSSVAIGMIESLHDLTALPSGSFDSSYCLVT